MRKTLLFALVVLVCFSLSSCYSSQLYVGGMKTNEPKTVLTSKTNNHFLLGLVSPSSNKQKMERYVKGHDKYAVKSHRTFLNIFLEVITCGIYAPSKTTFYVPLNEE